MEYNRPPTPYMLFAKEIRPQVVAELGAECTPKAVVARISQLWKEQGDAWKAANADLIAALRLSYQPSWKPRIIQILKKHGYMWDDIKL